MSISSALLTAQSGLRSSELRSNLVSSNIANVGTSGYVRRDVAQISVGTVETGRGADSRVVRNVDERLVALNHGATSDLSASLTRSNLLQGHLTALGKPGDEISPAAQFAQFQSGLDLLRNAPGDTSIQRDVLSRADSLVRSIKDGAQRLVATERAAQNEIEGSVLRVNEALSRLGALNAQMTPASSASRSPDILDQMGRELQILSEEMNITTTTDALGRVIVQTALGTELLRDDDPVSIRFDGATLSANDIDITPGSTGTRGFTTGALAGAFSLITEELPLMQLQFDELARGLVVSFEGADKTLASGGAGLFTDGGNPFDSTALDGLALRLTVNDAVRPTAGGELWRLRDGMNATAPGPASDSGQLEAFVLTLDAPQPFAAMAGLGGSARLADFAADLVGAQQNVGVQADEAATRQTVALRAFEEARGEVEGVNLDEELQKLLEIEQHYGANAKVLTSLTEMIDTLLAAV